MEYVEREMVSPEWRGLALPMSIAGVFLLGMIGLDMAPHIQENYGDAVQKYEVIGDDWKLWDYMDKVPTGQWDAKFVAPESDVLHNARLEAEAHPTKQQLVDKVRALGITDPEATGKGARNAGSKQHEVVNSEFLESLGLNNDIPSVLEDKPARPGGGAKGPGLKPYVSTAKDTGDGVGNAFTRRAFKPRSYKERRKAKLEKQKQHEDTEEAKTAARIPGWPPPIPSTKDVVPVYTPKAKELRPLNPKKDKPPRLVISITSLPSRLEYMEDVIKSLTWQHYPPDQVYLSIPRKSRRLEAEYVLPPFIKTNPDITVIWTDEDYGPATKLIPVLNVETDPQTLIMTVDDDAFPKENHLQILTTAAMMYPHAAVGFGGWNVTCIVKRSTCEAFDVGPGESGSYVFIRQTDSFACDEMWSSYGKKHCGNYPGVKTMANPHATDVIEGYEGAMYRRWFFDEMMMRDYTKSNKEMFYVDDVWISGNLARRGISRLIVPDHNLKDDELLPKRKRVWKGAKDTAGSYKDSGKEWSSPSDIDSLHGPNVDLFRANYYSVRWFHQTHKAWGIADDD